MNKHDAHLPLITNPKLFPSFCKHTSMVLVKTPEGFWTKSQEQTTGSDDYDCRKMKHIKLLPMFKFSVIWELNNWGNMLNSSHQRAYFCAQILTIDAGGIKLLVLVWLYVSLSCSILTLDKNNYLFHIYGQFRVANETILNVFGLWEERNPDRNRENM